MDRCRSRLRLSAGPRASRRLPSWCRERSAHFPPLHPTRRRVALLAQVRMINQTLADRFFDHAHVDACFYFSAIRWLAAPSVESGCTARTAQTGSRRVGATHTPWNGLNPDRRGTLRARETPATPRSACINESSARPARKGHGSIAIGSVGRHHGQPFLIPLHASVSSSRPVFHRRRRAPAGRAARQYRRSQPISQETHRSTVKGVKGLGSFPVFSYMRARSGKNMDLSENPSPIDPNPSRMASSTGNSAIDDAPVPIP